MDHLKGKHFIYKDTNVRKRCVVCYNTKTSGKKKMKDTEVLTVLNVNNICVLVYVLRRSILFLIINISVFVVLRIILWTS